MKEIWRDIKGYEGYYQVSTLGRVRSLDRTIKVIKTSPKGKVFVSERFYKGKIMSYKKLEKFYPSVALSKHGKNKHFMIHKLVAETFIPNIESKKCVNHINNVKYDNRIENLEWCTYSENSLHAVNYSKTWYLGEQQKNSKLTEKDVYMILDLLRQKNYKQKHIASFFGVTPSIISTIKLNTAWKYITREVIK